MKRIRGKRLFSALIGVFWCATALAQAVPQGDPAAGRVKFYTCMGCHGIPGYSNAYPSYDVPKLGGQHAQYLVSALQEYRKGARKHSTMHAQASSLSEKDIQDIAAFLSQQKAK